MSRRQRHKRVHDQTWKSSALAHLAAESGDPALQREQEHLAAGEYDSSRGFRRARSRLRAWVFVGR
jgi:hypothetical protein